MRNKHLCVFICISGLRERFVPLKMFEPFSNPFQGGASFVDPFCCLCYMCVFLMLSCLFLAAL